MNQFVYNFKQGNIIFTKVLQEVRDGNRNSACIDLNTKRCDPYKDCLCIAGLK